MKIPYWGEMCHKKRIERQITLREFCRNIGVDPSNWSKIERGIASPPKTELINKICDLLEIDEPYRTKFHMLAVMHVVDANTESLLDKLPILIGRDVDFMKLYRLLKRS